MMLDVVVIAVETRSSETLVMNYYIDKILTIMKGFS